MSTLIVDWNDQQRRMSSMASLGAAVVTILGALAVWWFVDSTPEWVYWVLVGVLVLVLAFMVLLMVLKPRASAQMAAEAAPAEAAQPVSDGAPAAMPAFEPRVLTLRCGDCGTIFDVTDTGERPLYHTCPGCGAEGALRDPVDAGPAADAMPEAAPEMPPPMPEAPLAPPPMHVAAAPAHAPIKKIKLRCGGCKEVFSIEDSGERPLKSACPSCGRMGMIK